MERTKPSLDVAKIKKDFPIMERKIHGKPLCYLDSAATSQKPRQVIDAVSEFYSNYNANVHRAIYELGEDATRGYEGAREKIAHFINARSSSEIVFTRGTTESINIVAYGWGMKGKLGKGDEIVSTVMEHHSNHIPWFFVQDYKGVKLSWIDIDDEGYLKMEDLDRLVTERTKMVAVTQCSNVLGTINPIKEIAKKAHEVNALCLVDAAQSVPHFPADVQNLDCDLLAFSGHKMLGPTGIGVLYGKEKVLEEMEPMLGGGEMIREVHLGRATWNDVPWKFEGGTPDPAGAVGLGAAIDYLSSLGMQNVRQHEIELNAYGLEMLGKIKGIRILGPMDPKKRGGLIAFTIPEAHPHDIAAILDAEGIAIRSGHNCAQPLMERCGIPATARASFYVYNSPEDIDRLIKGLKKVQEVFA
jgi:cysteine desulfurase/selenocysteine lyase